MSELKNLCYELLAKYASEKAWVADCFCKDDDERQKLAATDQSEILAYRERIESAAKSGDDEYIGLTD